MLDVLEHRGPDGQAVMVDGPLGFGLSRLAIMDLDISARVFSDDSGRFFAVTNGEIYNAREIRADLRSRGHVLKTRCDTEIVPYVLAEYGLEGLRRFDGIFALAAWDTTLQRLHLARDPFGVKPLLYARHRQGMAFSSTYKALFEDIRVPREPNWNALHHYLGLGYVPGWETPYAGVHRVPPASVLTFSAGDGLLDEWKYWTYPDVATTTPDRREAGERLWAELCAAVRRQTASDVPVGALLSGGLDSTAILAAMHETGSPPRVTYCAGYDTADADERQYARLAVERFGGRHEEVVLTSPEVPGVLEAAMEHLEEPSSDVSALPLLKICQAARADGCNVLLSGEGGDELLGGYDTYRAYRWASTYRTLPGLVRRGIARTVESASPRLLQPDLDFRVRRFVSGSTLPLVPAHLRWREVFSEHERRELLTTPQDLGQDTTAELMDQRLNGASRLAPLERLMVLDSLGYLVDDLLVKADRMSMAASVELRVPMTDTRLVEAVCALGSGYRSAQVGYLASRKLLRRIIAEKVPGPLAKRPKRGFSAPASAWLRGGLHSYFRDALHSSKLTIDNVLDRDRLERMAELHAAGTRDNWWPLWTVLCLLVWYEQHF